MSREFIAHSTKMLHFPVRLSTSASSNHDLSLAAFITDIAESDFRYTQHRIFSSTLDPRSVLAMQRESRAIRRPTVVRGAGFQGTIRSARNWRMSRTNISSLSTTS
jgi:hypothetical protein